MAEIKKPFHETVAEKLIEQLKQGTAPWQMPWKAGEPGAFLPVNPSTGKRYRGINAIHLMSQGQSDQRWMTYKQAAAIGAQVRKGEKGTPIQYWKFSEEQARIGADGKPVRDAQGEAVTQSIRLERPRVFFATVFNAGQIDGLPLSQAREEQQWNAVERAEQILRASDVVIRHGEHNRAFYRPATDSVHLPDKDQFTSADRYYATALHELGHATGHVSRLNRDLAHPFGSEGYAREELRAEIASMILGDELGIGHDPAQHAAYVGAWIKTLQHDPLEIFRAAADAERIQHYVLGLEQKQVQEQAAQQDQADEQPALLPLIDVHPEPNEHEMAARLARPPVHMMTCDEFTQVATAIALENHGQRWEVFAGEQSLGFSDSDTAAGAVKETHKREVNNALYSRSTENTGVIPVQDMPPERVLNEYPDLQEKFAGMVNFQHQAGQAPQALMPEKTFIDVPFKQKDEARALGAKWDRQEQSWYVPAGIDPASFARWTPGGITNSVATPQQRQNIDAKAETGKPVDERQYLAVPYGERVAARAAGAEWNKAAKSWYAGPKADMAKLERWKPDSVPGEQGPAMPPKEEFAEALRFLGCVVSGEHPIMDGQKHRISVEGEKFSEKAGAGFYVGFQDGHPAGYIKNNKTGIDMKWKSKGYVLEPGQKEQMQAEAAATQQARQARQERAQEQASQSVARQMADLAPVLQPTPYMLAKGIEPQPGVFTDKDGRTTCVPGTDVDGKQWTIQYIQEDGTKRFAKDSRKEGCFHVIGGMDALVQASALVIAEGYATASSLSQSLGYATVAAFDSGNLPHVAKALHAKFPDKPVIIAGDDDRHLETTQGINPGKIKALEAANATDGKVLLPIFAPGEQAANPKGYSDFNDLATKSALGKEGIDRQIREVVGSIVEEQHARTQQHVRAQQESGPRRSGRIR